MIAEVAVPRCQQCEFEGSSNGNFEDPTASLLPIANISNSFAERDSPAKAGHGKVCEVKGLTGKDVYHSLAPYLISCKDLTMWMEGSRQRIDVELGRDPKDGTHRYVKLELDVVSGSNMVKHAMDSGRHIDWNGIIDI